MIDFSLEDSEFIPLCDLMKIVGLVGTGAEAKHAIAEGKVKVDGQVETRKRCKIKSGQLVDYQGRNVKVV